MGLKEYLETTTQADIARLLGCSQGLVSQWLSGVQRVTAERAVQIEKVTDGKVTAAELRPDLFGERAA
jgi:DNA-binding transcriptional regulator YdaS (Cro superfamily)